MPSYVAIPATPSDIPDIATLMFKANASDLAFSAIYPKGNTPKTLMHFVAQLEEVMDEDPSAYMMIVKDASSGKCVGYAIWHFMTRGGIRGSSDVGKEFFPVEANVDLGVRLVSAGAKKRTEVLQELLAGREDDGYAYLSSIGIDPLHQRQGAAAKMLDWGVDRADDKALPIYVESTPAAIKLYSNFNFRPYDKLTIDLKPINEETVEHICMIRLPNST